MHFKGKTLTAKAFATRSFKPLAPVLLAATVSLLTPMSALGQDSSGNSANSEGFTLNTDSGFAQQNQFDSSGVSIELPAEGLGSQILDLDTTDLGCLSGGSLCLSPTDQLDMQYSKSLTTSIDTLLDIELTPRASMRFDDGNSSALVGALVRIGDDLKDGEELKSNTWYMFAGADAEAVTYSPNNLDRVGISDFHLQDRIIVGDAQAGVGYRLGSSTDISLGYFRREVTSFGNETDMESTRYTEDAAALSFTWRR